MEMRGDLIFVGLIYVLVGVVAATAVMGGALLPLLFPIVAGVGLLGPVAALGFYEMARRGRAGCNRTGSTSSMCANGQARTKSESSRPYCSRSSWPGSS